MTITRRNLISSWMLALLGVGGIAAETTGGLSWDAPAGWASQAKPMRAANYVVPAAGGGESGELAVYYFGPGQGGGVEANLKRWIGQFRAADGGPADAAAKRSQKTVNGIAISLLELDGTYLFKPFPRAPKAVEKPGYRMLAAIAQGPDAPIFFKLTGPAATVQAARAKFDALIGSIRKP